MRTMKSISNKLASLLLIAGAWVGGVAHAVQDLPGGPAVNQLNLHPLSPGLQRSSISCTG